MHKNAIAGVEIINNDHAATVDISGFVVLWNVIDLSANAAPRAFKLPHDSPVTCVSCVREALLLVGHADGTVSQMSVSERLKHKGRFLKVAESIMGISSSQDRIAIVSEVQLFVYDAKTSRQLFHAPMRGTFVDVNNRWIVTSSNVSAGFNAIAIFSAKDGRPSHRIYAHRGVDFRTKIISDGNLLLSSSADRSIRLHSLSSGEQLWGARLPSPAWDSCVLPDGRIATAMDSGGSTVYAPPLNIRQLLQFEGEIDMEISSNSPPLQQIYERVLKGTMPAKTSVSFIRKEVCSSSLEEWQAAHRILMNAVEGGHISRSAHHSGVDSWWLQELYLMLTKFNFKDDSEKQRMITYLREAENNGVLESVAAILCNLSITSNINSEMQKLHKEGTLLLQRMLKLERKMQDFASTSKEPGKEENRQLKRAQTLLSAQCVSPDILSTDSKPDEPSQIDPVELLLNSVNSLGKGPLLKNLQQLSMSGRIAACENWISNLDHSEREEVFEAIANSGMNAEELTELLQMFERMDMQSMTGTSGGSHESCEVTDEPTLFELPQSAREMADDGRNSGFSTPDPYSISSTQSAATADSDLEGNMCLGLESEMEHVPSFFRGIHINTMTIKKLGIDYISEWWAAFILCFRDDRIEMFRALSTCLRNFLTEQEIGSDLLTLYGSRTEIYDSVMDEVSIAMGEAVVLGWRLRARRFLELCATYTHR